jgi:hypothetical protein
MRCHFSATERDPRDILLELHIRRMQLAYPDLIASAWIALHAPALTCGLIIALNLRIE